MSAFLQVAGGLSTESGGSIAHGLTSLLAAPVGDDQELSDTAATAVGMLDEVRPVDLRWSNWTAAGADSPPHLNRRPPRQNLVWLRTAGGTSERNRLQSPQRRIRYPLGS